MDKKIAAEIEAILSRHETSKTAAKEARRVADEKAKAFLAEFTRIRESVIRPAIDEVGKLIAARGYEYRIETGDERFEGREQRLILASITAIFVVGGKNHPTDRYPHLSMMFDKYSGKVRFYQYAMTPVGGGQAGSVGEHELSKITGELVQKQLTELLSKVLR